MGKGTGAFFVGVGRGSASWLSSSAYPAIDVFKRLQWEAIGGRFSVTKSSVSRVIFQNRDDARKFMRFLHPDLDVVMACT